MWVQAAEKLSVWVRRLYPKPGNRVSFRAPKPNGSNSLSSKIEPRTKTLSEGLKV